MSSELETTLTRARQQYQAGNCQDPAFLQLARSSYEPAKSLFREMLDDAKADARYVGLQMLSKTTYLASSSELLDKIRDILLHDPDVDIRAQAAIVLGGHASWPDAALEQAVDHDPDRLTRQEALLSALQLMVSFDFADEYRDSIKSGALETSMATARKLVAEHQQKPQK